MLNGQYLSGDLLKIRRDQLGVCVIGSRPHRIFCPRQVLVADLEVAMDPIFCPLVRLRIPPFLS